MHTQHTQHTQHNQRKRSPDNVVEISGIERMTEIERNSHKQKKRRVEPESTWVVSPPVSPTPAPSQQPLKSVFELKQTEQVVSQQKSKPVFEPSGSECLVKYKMEDDMQSDWGQFCAVEEEELSAIFDNISITNEQEIINTKRAFSADGFFNSKKEHLK
tara:strand:+ start:19 stop:495 length:477 start_codon:yes stop_codon:yes gene_type:complete